MDGELLKIMEWLVQTRILHLFHYPVLWPSWAATFVRHATYQLLLALHCKWRLPARKLLSTMSADVRAQSTLAPSQAIPSQNPPRICHNEHIEIAAEDVNRELVCYCPDWQVFQANTCRSDIQQDSFACCTDVCRQSDYSLWHSYFPLYG